MCLSRDFSELATLQLEGAADEADAHWQRMLDSGRAAGYGWVRKSLCVGDDNGIYLTSPDHLHKVMWTGERLSTDEADGAWRARYRNGTGWGSGSTPSLMGFGPDEDRFVVIGDGDEVVNITLFWRDAIPEDWDQFPDAPSHRIAGLGRADMGDPDLEAIQTEQSITVSGYGAMTVNNQPPTLVEGLPESAARALCFYLGHDPAFRPLGLHKYEWNPATRTLEEAWVCTTVSSPNSVPFVSQGSDLVYTCGTRERQWTIEAVDWTTGEPAFHYVLGGSMFNTLGAGVTVMDDGRLLFGTVFGKARVLRLCTTGVASAPPARDVVLRRRSGQGCAWVAVASVRSWAQSLSWSAKSGWASSRVAAVSESAAARALMSSMAWGSRFARSERVSVMSAARSSASAQ